MAEKSFQELTDFTTGLVENEDGEFYFESDHLALKGNKDYTACLKAIVTLEAQRVKALADLDELLLQQSKARQDPIAFVAKLQNGELNLPGPQKIAEIPNVDWSKYELNETESRQRPQTRHGNVTQKAQIKHPEDETILVRGRKFNDSKPETFNQLWGPEEQLKLTALMDKYVTGENMKIGMTLFRKISKEMGNRSSTQVASRVQKYVMKLSDEGQSLYGKKPKSSLVKKSSKSKKKSYKRQVTTFFPDPCYSSIENEATSMEKDLNYPSRETSQDVNFTSIALRSNYLDPNIGS